MSDPAAANRRGSDAGRLGGVGVWSFGLDRLSIAESRTVAQEIERCGYRSLWIAEGVGSREALTHASALLAATSRLIVGTGIASIWARDPIAMAAGWRTLSDAYPDRFVLGMGVSHLGAATRRGHRYADRPLTHLREYLDRMDDAPLLSPVPAPPPRRVLAALRPRMLELAAQRADGAHTYFVSVEHTRRARGILGRGPLLVVEQAVVLERSPATARRVAREHTGHYLARDNYRRNLESLGMRAGTLEDGGSDAVVDALVAWGDEAAVRERVDAHHRAGADHVVVQVLGQGDGVGPTVAGYHRVAEILGLS